MKRLNFLKLLVFFGALFIFYKCADTPTSDVIERSSSSDSFLLKLSTYNNQKVTMNSNLYAKPRGF